MVCINWAKNPTVGILLNHADGDGTIRKQCMFFSVQNTWQMQCPFQCIFTDWSFFLPIIKHLNNFKPLMRTHTAPYTFSFAMAKENMRTLSIRPGFSHVWTVKICNADFFKRTKHATLHCIAAYKAHGLQSHYLSAYEHGRIKKKKKNQLDREPLVVLRTDPAPRGPSKRPLHHAAQCSALCE